jgi:WD40 repeat protein
LGVPWADAMLQGMPAAAGVVRAAYGFMRGLEKLAEEPAAEDTAGAGAASSASTTASSACTPRPSVAQQQAVQFALLRQRLLQSVLAPLLRRLEAQLAPAVPAAASQLVAFGHLTAASVAAAPRSRPIASWLRASLVAVAPDGAHLISCGYWDGTLRIASLATGATAQVLALPERQPASCLALARVPPPAVAACAAGLMRTPGRPDALPNPGAAVLLPYNSGSGGGPSSGVYGLAMTAATAATAAAAAPTGLPGWGRVVTSPALSAPAPALPFTSPSDPLLSLVGGGAADTLTSSGASAVPAAAWNIPPSLEAFPGYSGAVSPAQAAVVAAGSAAAFTLLVGGLDGHLRWFAMAGPAHVHPCALADVCNHSAPVSAVACSPATDTAVSGSLDGTVNVYGLRSARLRFTLHPLAAAGDGQAEGSPEGSPPPRPAATAPRTGVFDGATCAPGARLVRPITWAGVSPARIIAAYSACDSCLHAYSLEGTPLAPPLRLPFSAHAFCWSLDGCLLVVGGDGPHVLVLNAATLDVLFRVGLNGAYLTPEPGARLALSETARATAGNDVEAPASMASPPSLSGAELWHEGLGAPLPAAFTEAVTSVALTEHEHALVVGFADGQMRIYTLLEAPATAKMLSRFEEKVGF